MAKNKGTRILITLECTEAKKAGLPPSRYSSTKNKKKIPERLEMMKYNKFMKKHTLHKEVK